MKFYLISLLIFFLPLISHGSIGHFSYHEKSKKCVNSQGVEGFNNPDLQQIFILDAKSGTDSQVPTISNKDLECTQLKNLNFNHILNSGASYIRLKNWNLKGAVLSQTNITWIEFAGGFLDGANLLDVEIGYTLFQRIHIDKYTKGLSAHCLATQVHAQINCQM